MQERLMPPALTYVRGEDIMQTKPSIVFCHGIWADGSCFNKVIPTLQADGYEVMAARYCLDTNEGDFATVGRTLGRVRNPAILVGHSYGGSVITAAGTDDRVAGLVYIAALAPDAGETSQSQQDKSPVTDVFKYVEVADGRVWMRPEGVTCFAGMSSTAIICSFVPCPIAQASVEPRRLKGASRFSMKNTGRRITCEGKRSPRTVSSMRHLLSKWGMPVCLCADPTDV